MSDVDREDRALWFWEPQPLVRVIAIGFTERVAGQRQYGTLFDQPMYPGRTVRCLVDGGLATRIIVFEPDGHWHDITRWCTMLGGPSRPGERTEITFVWDGMNWWR